jgi:hypothetical protein
MTFDADFLSIPITFQTRAFAQRCAQLHPLGPVAQRVWEHGLAVGAIGQYLELLGIPTQPSHSDLSNPVVQLAAAVADLEVVGMGRLECCVIQTGAQEGQVPPEVWSEEPETSPDEAIDLANSLRIGYIFVRLNADQRSAEILGFLPRVRSETVSLSELLPLAELGPYLDQVRTQLAPRQVSRSFIKLGDWIRGLISDGWQQLEAGTLFPQPLAGYCFRWSGQPESDTQTPAPQSPETLGNQPQTSETIRCAKVLQDWQPLNRQEAKALPESVVLVVEVYPNEWHTTRLSLQVHPGSERRYLPPEVELTVLDQAGESFLTAKSRQQDDYIQLQFNGVAGEAFRVKVIADSCWVQEFFQI